MPHAIDLLRGDADKAELVHHNIAKTQIHLVGQQKTRDDKPQGHYQHHGHHHHHHGHRDTTKSKYSSFFHSISIFLPFSGSIDTGNVAGRPRESPYPMITFDEALSIVLDKAAEFPRRIVHVPMLEALDRILAEDIRAEDPQPPFPASIKDGYAVVG